MQDAYLVNGGKKLSGHVDLSGAKNVALKIIIAACMFDEALILRNIPHIVDVDNLLQLIRELGGRAEFIGTNTVSIDGRTINKYEVSMISGSKIRTSFMLAAPLLHKFGHARIPNPGGCRLGARAIDRIISGLQALGVVSEYDSATGYYDLKMNNRPEGRFDFPKSSHTGTEFFIMLAALSDKRVVIGNAALEPEVDDLISFLQKSGVRIVRQGREIVIYGCKKLKNPGDYAIISDRIEAVTYAVSAIATGGDVVISHIRQDLIEPFLIPLRRMGAGLERINETTWRFFASGRLDAVNIMTAPHPGFLTDWQPLYAVLATQAQGDTVIHETVLENRFSYVEELRKLGADIDFIDIYVENPQELYQFNYDPNHEYKLAIRIHGGRKLHGGVLRMSDIRAGVTLVVGALIAQGESIVYEAYHLERGYEDFVTKIQKIGGEIRAV